MTHRPWKFLPRLVERMADSSLLDGGFELQPRPPRTGGIHVSTLLRKLHPIKKGNQVDVEQLALFGLVGLAFEDRAELALISLSREADWPWHCFRPGEVSQDGITGSPDILMVPKAGFPGETRELSLKVSWSSALKMPKEGEGENGFPPGKFTYYTDQCMSYATPLDTMGAVLMCLFVNGSFGKENFMRIPEIHAWELEWSEQERAETWDALLGIAGGE